MNFDGITDHLTVPYSADFNLGGGDYAVMCWVRTTTSNPEIIDMWNAGAGNIGFFLQLYSTKMNFFVSDGIGVQYFAPVSVNITDGNLHHIAMVKRGSTMYGYVDGVESSGIAITRNPGGSGITGYVAIGPGGVRPLAGDIDDLRIYKARTITANQMKYIYEQKGRDGDTTGLVLRLLLTNGKDGSTASGTIEDVSGNGNNATVVNAPTYKAEPLRIL